MRSQGKKVETLKWKAHCVQIFYRGILSKHARAGYMTLTENTARMMMAYLHWEIITIFSVLKASSSAHPQHHENALHHSFQEITFYYNFKLYDYLFCINFSLLRKTASTRFKEWDEEDKEDNRNTHQTAHHHSLALRGLT